MKSQLDYKYTEAMALLNHEYYLILIFTTARSSYPHFTEDSKNLRGQLPCQGCMYLWSGRSGNYTQVFTWSQSLSFFIRTRKLTKHLKCQIWFSVIYNKIIEFTSSPKGNLIYLWYIPNYPYMIPNSQTVQGVFILLSLNSVCFTFLISLTFVLFI